MGVPITVTEHEEVYRVNALFDAAVTWIEDPLTATQRRSDYVLQSQLSVPPERPWQGVLVSRYALQAVLDELPTCFKDAMLLDVAVEKSLAQLTERRIAVSGRGNGAPPAFHGSMNRAVVVAAVGGIEAFFEILAEEARTVASPLPSPECNDWFTVKGRHGEIQTPSPRNVRRMFWSIFHVDLMDSWQISVTSSESDGGGTGTWRRAHSHTHSGVDASTFLNAMVRVRHSFAHMDDSQASTAVGMASQRANGDVVVHSHHAFNAVSAALQVSVQSTLFLARELDLVDGPRRPRWKKPWENVRMSGIGIDYWLSGTPVWENEIVTWAAAPTGLSLDPDDDLETASGIPVLTEGPPD